MIELFCDSFDEVPRRILLDIDDTLDRVHGQQQLSLFNAHYDSRCFLPIHVYEATTGKPVAVILRPGKTPGGTEVALVLRHVVKAIRARWPRVEIVIRGDGHYARFEAMAWLERHRVGYVFGLPGNKVLLAKVAGLAESTALRRVEENADRARAFADLRYAARSWQDRPRRVIARIEASPQGSDSRFIVTNLTGTSRWLYEVLYCGRGQAENLMYGRLPPCKWVLHNPRHDGVSCGYVFGLCCGHTAAGLDEIRDRRPIIKSSSKLSGSLGLRRPRSDRSCHRGEDHPRSWWEPGTRRLAAGQLGA